MNVWDNITHLHDIANAAMLRRTSLPPSRQERITAMTTFPPSDPQCHTRRQVLRTAAYVTPTIVAMGLRPSVGLAASGARPGDPALSPPGGQGNPLSGPPGDPSIPPPPA